MKTALLIIQGVIIFSAYFLRKITVEKMGK
jgi:hypothetical protein